MMKVVEQAILSTDLALYFRKKDRFLETANCGEIDWQEQEKKECKLTNVLLHTHTLLKKATETLNPILHGGGQIDPPWLIIVR